MKYFGIMLSRQVVVNWLHIITTGSVKRLLCYYVIGFKLII